MNTIRRENVEKAFHDSLKHLHDLQVLTREKALGLAEELQAEGKRIAEERLETLQEIKGHALHTAADLVARVPQFEAHAEKLRAEAHKLENAASPGIANYETLNVRDILPLLEGLDADQLAWVARTETAGKARKTVLASVEREIARRAQG